MLYACGPQMKNFHAAVLWNLDEESQLILQCPPPIYPQIYQTFHKHAFPSSLVLPRETSQLVLRLHVEHTSNSGV